jgi:hypothetical protein
MPMKLKILFPITNIKITLIKKKKKKLKKLKRKQNKKMLNYLIMINMILFLKMQKSQ